MKETIQILIDFAEGTITAKNFEQLLYSNKSLEKLLSDESINYSKMCLEGYINAYDYLIRINYQDAGDVLNAHDIVCKVLIEKDVQFQPTEKYSDFYDLILSSQPKYLDMDTTFFEQHIWQADFADLKKKEKLSNIKENIKKLFRYHKKPPKWIQNPNWLIENDKPLYFLGQHEIKACELFHDNGFVYLFVNESREIKTVTQLY